VSFNGKLHNEGQSVLYFVKRVSWQYEIAWLINNRFTTTGEVYARVRFALNGSFYDYEVLWRDVLENFDEGVCNWLSSDLMKVRTQLNEKTQKDKVLLANKALWEIWERIKRGWMVMKAFPKDMDEADETETETSPETEESSEE
jgi:hypothetical protein